MDLLELGSWSYHVGGFGILAFTLLFLAAVRWASDLLGRVLMAVLLVMSAIFLTGGYRLIYGEDSEGFLLWRAFLYTSFAVVIWMAFAAFIWSQFFAPRIKRNMTTRRDKKDEEVRMARHRADRDGDLHDGPGRSDG